MKNILLLGNPAKVFPLSLLVSSSLLGCMYFLHKGNTSDTEQMIALAATVISFILFVVLYSIQNKVIAMEMVSDIQDEDPPTIKETISDLKYFCPSILGLMVCFMVMFSIVIPTIGSVAGGIFQISVAGLEFNALTLILRLVMVTWLLYGTAQISSMESSVIDTIKFIPGFVFTNFSKTIGLCFTFIVLLFLFQFLLVSTATSNPMVVMPIKIVILGYMIGFLNTFATKTFVNNIEDTDFADEEYED